jgi:hypothetical protein
MGMRPTFPALWLKSNPPSRRVGIHECTSWSCHHGVLRWTGNCACTPGDGAWKAQLRHAFERLAEELDRLYEDVAASLVGDPWELRNRYIGVVLGKETLAGLLAGMTERTLTSEQVRRVHLMLEAQRERQRMFTSCGWFFDDFDRIEPKNNVAYAAQAVRLARLATGVDLEQAVVADLQRVVSRRTAMRADRVFLRHLRRAEGVQSVRIGYAD